MKDVSVVVELKRAISHEDVAVVVELKKVIGHERCSSSGGVEEGY